MKRFFKICGLLFLSGVLLAGILAAVFVFTGYWAPDLYNGQIVLDDEVINWHVPPSSARGWITAWLAVWFGLIVAALAVVFAFSVAGAALLGTGLLMFSPVIVLGLLIWWLAGRKPAPSLPAANKAAQPPAI